MARLTVEDCLDNVENRFELLLERQQEEHAELLTQLLNIKN